MSAKISPPLADALEEGGNDPVDVIVEVASPRAADVPGASRAEKIANLKAAFDRSAQPVAARIRGMGGEVTGEAWINCSLRARLPRKLVQTLADEDQVVKLDLPGRIRAETG